MATWEGCLIGLLKAIQKLTRHGGMLALGVICTAPCQAASLATEGKVYCRPQSYGIPLVIFAEKIRPNGQMAFGISIWAGGRHFGVFGSAIPDSGRWIYTNNILAVSPEARCRLDIEMQTTGAVRIATDPGANCENWGGQGMAFETLVIPAQAYEGPVTFELDDIETFFNKAGKCDKAP